MVQEHSSDCGPSICVHRFATCAGVQARSSNPDLHYGQSSPPSSAPQFNVNQVYEPMNIDPRMQQDSKRVSFREEAGVALQQAPVQVRGASVMSQIGMASVRTSPAGHDVPHAQRVIKPMSQSSFPVQVQSSNQSGNLYSSHSGQPR